MRAISDLNLSASRRVFISESSNARNDTFTPFRGKLPLARPGANGPEMDKNRSLVRTFYARKGGHLPALPKFDLAELKQV